MVGLSKRVALAAWPRTAVAALAGAESSWPSSGDSGGTPRSAEDRVPLLDDAEYRPRGAQLDDARLQ